MNGSPGHLAYALKRVPRLSETFILNEILELERQGVSLEIFALLEPAEEIRHEAVKRLQARVTYLPQHAPRKSWSVREGHCADGIFLERSFPELFGHGALRQEAVLFLKAATLAAMARARGVRHFHAHFGTGATTVAMLASRLTGIPYSFTAHAKDIYHADVDEALLKEKIRGAQFVITVSEYNRQHLASLLDGIQAGNIIRLYNGIELDRFTPDPTLGRDDHLILAVGRLVEKKGFSHLVQACRLLLERQRTFQCLIVGDGPQLTSLAQQVKALGLQEHVSLIGAQPQERVLELLKQATMVVLPCVVSSTGDRDALPTVLLEAFAVGALAISTSVSGIPEIIAHGQTGLLVPPGDPARLAHVIEEVLRNPELRERLGRAGRLKAEELFDIRKNALVLRELFASSAVGQEGVVGAPS